MRNYWHYYNSIDDEDNFFTRASGVGLGSIFSNYPDVIGGVPAGNNSEDSLSIKIDCASCVEISFLIFLMDEDVKKGPQKDRDSHRGCYFRQ